MLMDMLVVIAAVAAVIFLVEASCKSSDFVVNNLLVDGSAECG
jgi:hypothetical protein